MKQFRIQLAALTVLSFFILATTAMAIESIVRVTNLDGQQEVGGGDPDGIGFAEIQWNEVQQQVCWKISYENIASPTAAHIHKALEGFNGPIVISLSPIESGCALISDLSLIRDIIQNPDQYYINVHNLEYSGGAIRGQLSELCDCEKSSVRPKFLGGDNKPADFIKITAERVAGRGKGAIEVKIDTDWVATLVCRSTVETDVCRELFALKGSSSDWKVNVPKNPKKGNGVGGSAAKESFESGGLTFKFCENKCDGVERSNDFSTIYKATVENSDRDGFTFKEIKGKVKLEISSVLCKDKSSWTMIIAVDSTQKGNYNEDASDFDGDGVDNGVEKKTDSDGDKLSDYEEMLIGTDPTKKDTDGDSVDDKKDKFPLDKDRQ